MEQAVFQAGALDLDMLGQLEATLKGAAGDAMMQIRCFLRLFALAGDGEDAVILDGKVLFAKAGDRDGDAVIILVRALDIVGRIALARVGGFQKIQQAIETDSAAEEGE